jgi:hypothetical protein
MFIPTEIAPAQLTGSAAAYYTSPATPAPVRSIIKKLVFANNSVNAETVTVYLVPNGGSAGVTNIVWVAKTLAAGETKECFEAENQVLLPGDTLQALASTAAKVTLTGSVIQTQ